MVAENTYCFDQARVQRALQRSAGDVDAAVEWLIEDMGDDDLVVVEAEGRSDRDDGTAIGIAAMTPSSSQVAEPAPDMAESTAAAPDSTAVQAQGHASAGVTCALREGATELSSPAAASAPDHTAARSASGALEHGRLGDREASATSDAVAAQRSDASYINGTVLALDTSLSDSGVAQRDDTSARTGADALQLERDAATEVSAESADPAATALAAVTSALDSSSVQPAHDDTTGSGDDAQAACELQAVAGPGAARVQRLRKKGLKQRVSVAGKPPAKNKLCPCNSGRKYKNCCKVKDDRKSNAGEAAPPVRRPVSRADAAAMHLASLDI